ncbi:MAG: enoyl-CoA hydratase/isomerase family protein [Deltaproteobacteria bacterium]|nr:enoyl-CoA hydratase/isomerase family protein [Deltaproteobacteria bacterium]
MVRKIPHSGVLFAEESAGRFKLASITLDSPNNLNALNLDMFRALEEKLLTWRQREDIACVVMHATADKAFCAGGDIKSLTMELRTDPSTTYGQEFFAAEYFVDYLIHVYPKPILCWADGITMGGGIGIMNGASHRVVTEQTVMAMPEVQIGFFPDVGATHFFHRLPGRLGLFLGLTAARFDGFDAVAIGMADALVAARKKQALLERLLRLDWSGEPGKDRELLSRHLAHEKENNPAGRSRLLHGLDEIGRLVERQSIEEIDAAFRSWSGSKEWIQRALVGYSAGSPTSIKVAFEQFKRGKGLSLKEAFLREWDMAMNFCAHSDVCEGIRALLIDILLGPLGLRSESVIVSFEGLLMVRPSSP